MLTRELHKSHRQIDIRGGYGKARRDEECHIRNSLVIEVAQMACRVVFGYMDVVKRQEVPGGTIYRSSRSTELVSKRLLAVMSLWYQRSSNTQYVLGDDRPLYDLVICWKVKSTVMNLGPLVLKTKQRICWTAPYRSVLVQTRKNAIKTLSLVLTSD